MIKFEFNKKNGICDLKIKDVTGLDLLSAIESFGRSIQLFLENNIHGDGEEEFKKDVLDCFRHGLYSEFHDNYVEKCIQKALGLNEKSEDDIKRAIEKVIEKLAEVACKEEL